MTEDTQPSTQQMLDPRRDGRNTSDLIESDISDIICILLPTTKAAIDVVASTAHRSPQHVLQKRYLLDFDDFGDDGDQDTFIVQHPMESKIEGLALRFSSSTIAPLYGFVFGRNEKMADIVFAVDSLKRISNTHFRIFIKETGVVMIEDVSTNGTLVDGAILRGKPKQGEGPGNATRVLTNGTMIHLQSTKHDEEIKFMVRFPGREGHEAEYGRKFNEHMNRIHLAAQNQPPGKMHQKRAIPQFNALPVIPSATFGMKWDGGSKYNVTNHIGNGAFANVYQLTTKFDGRLLAVKELEKRRFIKDGVLDKRLQNEINIMQSVKHPHIVEYIDYHDERNHLYIIMEYVACGDLQKYLRQHHVLSESNAKLMSRQTLGALAYLHKEAVTHRDIKPDNILIASLDPFVVKLSDFGLSKAVKTDETFLTTFCGTLLYCAPEVFPHYQGSGATQGIKRQRKENHRSYNDAVDIWSYGGVLWFALCAEPPFEGVVDPTGKGMFEKIMHTSLQPAQLDVYNISNEAKDLLQQMLRTLPASRPSAISCLKHPWLADGSEASLLDPIAGLNSILEEDEEAPEQPFSQLSIKDSRARPGVVEEEEDELNDSDLDLDYFEHNTVRSKRVKIDPRFPRHQMRDHSEESSEELSAQEREDSPVLSTGEVLRRRTTPARKLRLFGEIGESALASSGLLGEQTTRALAVNPRTARQQVHDHVAAESVVVAEAMVRGINIDTPGSGQSLESNDFASSYGSSRFDAQTNDLPDGQQPSHGEESQETPKGQIHRTIRSMSSPAGVAESVSVTPTRPRLGSNKENRIGQAGMLDTAFPAFDADKSIPSSPPAIHARELPPDLAELWARKPPTMGTLTVTDDSDPAFQVFLGLEKRYTSWGRLPTNDIVYPDPTETRIPKTAFNILYWAANIVWEERAGDKWKTLPDLQVRIIARGSSGLYVNGAHLPTPDGRQSYYGNLYTGDVITVFNHSQPLRLICMFNFGEAAKTRPHDKPFKPKLSQQVLTQSRPSQTSSRSAMR